MNSFTNDDLYKILLHRAAKDRKGSISPEEFESFLRIRSIDYFNQQSNKAGETMANMESLSPFMIHNDVLSVTQEGSTGVYYVDLSYDANTTTTTTVDPDARLSNECVHIINAFYAAADAENGGRPAYTSLVEMDILSHGELLDRLGNAITAPSATSPVGYIANDKLYVYGLTSGFVLLTYYRYPTAPYYDYYVDSSGNITYLTDGQASYTLQTGEVARDGSTAGSSVTSASVDLEWGDDDAMNILDMVMTDFGIAISDQATTQGSLLERQQNV